MKDKNTSVGEGKNLSSVPTESLESRVTGSLATPRPWGWRYTHHGRDVAPRAENSTILIRSNGADIARIQHQWTDTGIPFWPDKPAGATRKELNYAETEANAELIVRAVNSYDALVEAAQLALHAGVVCCGWDSDEPGQSTRDAADKLRTTLALTQQTGAVNSGDNEG